MKDPEKCYLSTGHDGHDLLGPGESCKACGFVMPTAPRELAEAVARLEAVERDERAWLTNDVRADLRLVLAALAEAQSEVAGLRAAEGGFVEAGEVLAAENVRLEAALAEAQRAVGERERALLRAAVAAQAEVAKLKPVVDAALRWAEMAKRTGVGWGVSRDLIEAADAYRALAAPPPTAATPEGK